MMSIVMRCGSRWNTEHLGVMPFAFWWFNRFWMVASFGTDIASECCEIEQISVRLSCLIVTLLRQTNFQILVKRGGCVLFPQKKVWVG